MLTPATIARHGGFVLVIAGVFLPWLRVAPSNRSGFDSAELLISLSEIGLPEGLRALGVIWYLAATAALIGWAASNLVSRAGRMIGVVGAVSALVLWFVFGVVAGLHGSLNARAVGPAVAGAGCALIAASTALRRPDHDTSGT